jgi:hypothetical protein
MILAFIVVAEIIDGFHPSFGGGDLYSACPDPCFCGRDSGSLGRDLCTSFCDVYTVAVSFGSVGLLLRVAVTLVIVVILTVVVNHSLVAEILGVLFLMA